MHIVALALVLIAAPFAALAQDAHLLQQRASFAYREMQRAERDAELADAEAKDHARTVAQLREQLEAADKQTAQARKRADEARARAAEARKRWQTASDALERTEPRPSKSP